MLLVYYTGTGLTDVWLEYLVMHCTSHTLSGQQALIEWSNCTSTGGYIAMILTTNMAITGNGRNLTRTLVNANPYKCHHHHMHLLHIVQYCHKKVQ